MDGLLGCFTLSLCHPGFSSTNKTSVYFLPQYSQFFLETYSVSISVLALLPFHKSGKGTFTPAHLFSVSVLYVYCRKIDNTDGEREENKHHKPTTQRKNSVYILYLDIHIYISTFIYLFKISRAYYFILFKK